MEPGQPSWKFVTLTFIIILLYCITNAAADPYENCDVKKIVTYDGKELISAEVSFNCYSKYESEKIKVEVAQLPAEELPPVVSLTEFYNDWMN